MKATVPRSREASVVGGIATTGRHKGRNFDGMSGTVHGIWYLTDRRRFHAKYHCDQTNDSATLTTDRPECVHCHSGALLFRSRVLLFRSIVALAMYAASRVKG